jgi:hypothetical protein
MDHPPINLNESHLVPKSFDDEPEVIEGLSQQVHPITQPRLTVVQQVYYENEDGATQLATLPFTQTLESEEQPYSRTIKVAQEWTPIDLGWLKKGNNGSNPNSISDLNFKASLFCIINMEGRHGSVMPTEEELADTKSRIIDIGVEYTSIHLPKPVIVPFGYILPRGTLPIAPISLDRYYVRCRKGIAKVKYSIVPV